MVGARRLRECVVRSWVGRWTNLRTPVGAEKSDVQSSSTGNAPQSTVFPHMQLSFVCPVRDRWQLPATHFVFRLISVIVLRFPFICLGWVSVSVSASVACGAFGS